jgi:hypothetical protein
LVLSFLPPTSPLGTKEIKRSGRPFAGTCYNQASFSTLQTHKFGCAAHATKSIHWFSDKSIFNSRKKKKKKKKKKPNKQEKSVDFFFFAQ